jgi:UDP-N-acetylmuramoyl-tripeptide--D-alanyl-D-alanine ligase
MGIPLQSAVRSVATVPPFRGRLQPVLLPNGAVILRDDYNASLDGSDAAFQVMRTAKAQRRVLVFSDLSDFGGNRKKRLRYVGALLPSICTFAVFIGDSVDYAIRRAIEAGLPPDAVHGFTSLREASGFLKQNLRAGDLVLLKGRTTDHIARLFFAQVTAVSCWKTECHKTRLCDECWELGVPQKMRDSNPLSNFDVISH